MLLHCTKHRKVKNLTHAPLDVVLGTTGPTGREAALKHQVFIWIHIIFLQFRGPKHSSSVDASLESHQGWSWSRGAEGDFPTSSWLKAAQQSLYRNEYSPHKVILYFYLDRKVFHLKTKTIASGKSQVPFF